MLDRLHRIRATEFPDFRASGKVISGSSLRLKHIPGSGTVKVAVVVGKKHYKTNAARNHFRRRVYSAIRLRLKEFDERRGMLIVSPMKKVEEISWADIVNDLASFIAK